MYIIATFHFVKFSFYSENIDDGEALRQLIEAEKQLLGNNFPQAVMTLGCCAIGANYELIVKEYGGYGLPVLYGAPQSAKTTALKAALSVFGESDIVQGNKICV